MNRFDEILKNVPSQQEEADYRPQGVPWGGVLLCQICDEECEKVMHYPVEQMLRGKCPEGHESIIEKFRLGG